jgi:hypothetical protein
LLPPLSVVTCMRSLEIEDTAPGKLASYGRESYYRPEPLPPSSDLALDDEFYDVLAECSFNPRLAGPPRFQFQLDRVGVA